MKRVDTATSVAAFGGYAAGPNPDQHFTDGGAAPGDGTIPSAQWFEMVQEELAKAILDYDGVALSATDDTQLRTFLALRIKAIRGAVADTGVLTNTHLRAVIASTISRATGAESACIASDGALASGADSAVIASGAAQAAGAESMVAAGGGTASGARSAILASSGASTFVGSTGAAVIASAGSAVSGDATSNQTLVASSLQSGAGVLEATGEQSAVIASVASGGGDVQATGAMAVVIASAGTGAASDSIASGDNAAVLASVVGTASGDKSAVIASDGAEASGDGSAVIASGVGFVGGVVASTSNSVAMAVGKGGASGIQSAVIAGGSDVFASGEETCLLASEESELFTANAIGGGATGVGIAGAPTGANQQMTWRITSADTDNADADGNPGTGGGDIYSDGTVGAGAADYAEMFANLEPGVSVPMGALVSRVGPGVRAAIAGDRLLGVMSPTPAVLGNNPSLGWRGRHERNEWGRPVMRPRTRAKWPKLTEECVRWPEQTAVDDDGSTMTARVAYDGSAADAPTPWPESASTYRRTTRERYEGWADKSPIVPLPDDAETWERPVRVPAVEHDPGKEYVDRRSRTTEWTCVGLLGQLLVRVEKGVGADDWIEAGEVPGVGRKASGPPTDGGARVECMEITSKFEKGRGFAIARGVGRP